MNVPVRSKGIGKIVLKFSGRNTKHRSECYWNSMNKQQYVYCVYYVLTKTDIFTLIHQFECDKVCKKINKNFGDLS